MRIQAFNMDWFLHLFSSLLRLWSHQVKDNGTSGSTNWNPSVCSSYASNLRQLVNDEVYIYLEDENHVHLL